MAVRVTIVRLLQLPSVWVSDNLPSYRLAYLTNKRIDRGTSSDPTNPNHSKQYSLTEHQVP